MKNMEHGFNPGILEVIFTLGISHLNQSGYKPTSPDSGSDPKPIKSKDSHWL